MDDLATRSRHHRRHPGCGQPLISSVGMRRRLRALYALGWPWQILAARLGIDMWALEALINLPKATRRAARRVNRLYDELAMTPGPCPKARNDARRKHWAPPLAWDDDRIDQPWARPECGPYQAKRSADEVDPVVVERITRGRFCPAMTRAERITVVARLAASGHNDKTIAGHLGCSQDAVLKIRVRAGIGSGYCPP